MNATIVILLFSFLFIMSGLYSYYLRKEQEDNHCLIIGDVYRESVITYYEYIGHGIFIQYDLKQSDPRKLILLVTTIGECVKIPKNSKDFLKVKKEIFDKILKYRQEESIRQYIKFPNKTTLWQ